MVSELFIGSELWAEVRITNSSIKDVDSHQKIQNKYGFKMVNSFWTTRVKRSFSASQWNHTRLVWAPRSSSSAALIRWGNPYGSVLWVHRDVCSRGVFLLQCPFLWFKNRFYLFLNTLRWFQKVRCTSHFTTLHGSPKTWISWVSVTEQKPLQTSDVPSKSRRFPCVPRHTPVWPSGGWGRHRSRSGPY